MGNNIENALFIVENSSQIILLSVFGTYIEAAPIINPKQNILVGTVRIVLFSAVLRFGFVIGTEVNFNHQFFAIPYPLFRLRLGNVELARRQAHTEKQHKNKYRRSYAFLLHVYPPIVFYSAAPIRSKVYLTLS